MKLRLRGNSLRLRLTQRDVHALVETGSVEETTSFGPDVTLTYVLAVAPAGDSSVRAAFEAGVVRVTLPAAEAHAWATSERVAIEVEQPAGAGGSLRVLVEKDFACLKTRSGESEEDAYPNPHPTC